MPSCISKGRFVRVRISILSSKKIFGHPEAVEADPGGQPDTDIEVTLYIYLKVGLLGSGFQFFHQK